MSNFGFSTTKKYGSLHFAFEETRIFFSCAGEGESRKIESGKKKNLKNYPVTISRGKNSSGIDSAITFYKY